MHIISIIQSNSRRFNFLFILLLNCCISFGASFFSENSISKYALENIKMKNDTTTNNKIEEDNFVKKYSFSNIFGILNFQFNINSNMI